MDKRILIIGLGVFGQALMRDLKEQNIELIIADIDMKLIERFKNDADLAICMDTTDEAQLKTLNPKEIDVAIVAIGENFECNLLTSVQLKEMGVKKVIARATKNIQKKILLKSGIDLIITPEEVVARLLSKDIVEDTTIIETYMKKLNEIRDQNEETTH